MTSSLPLTTTRIRTLFVDEITTIGGKVCDVFEDGSRLFMRSVLPELRHVGHDDAVQGGVALRVSAHEIRVQPYVFRLVCKNGAIMAHALQAKTVENSGSLSAQQATEAVCAAIRACGSAEAFAVSAGEMRAARDEQADLALNLAPLLSSLGPDLAAAHLDSLLNDLITDEDRSRFGLMNAVTAIAREVPDPDLRWRLEEYGGGIAVGIVPTPERIDASARSLAAMRESLRAEQPADLDHGDRRLLVGAVA